MQAIGFRCDPNGFAYVILDGTQYQWTVVDYDTCNVPPDFKTGMRLWWVRKQIIELLDKFEISVGGLKRRETMMGGKGRTGPNIKPKITEVSERSEIEGVIKEVFYSTLKQECNARLKQQLVREILGLEDYKRAKEYLESHLSSTDFNKLKRNMYLDATLAAVSELPQK
ncbi:hypothetical protein ES703_18254 [subsurface metagenome]|nr:hypothetical protein [bacterium]